VSKLRKVNESIFATSSCVVLFLVLSIPISASTRKKSEEDMDEDLSLSLELGGYFTKRKREKFSEKEIIDKQGGDGRKTETEKNLEEPLIMHLGLPSVISDMKNSKISYFICIKLEVSNHFNLCMWSYI
jgi:hypothetical protein